jgi:hypothetical protein
MRRSRMRWRTTSATLTRRRRSEAPGFKAGYWTREGDTGLSLSIFDSEEHARAGADQVPSNIPDDEACETSKSERSSRPHSASLRARSRPSDSVGATRRLTLLVADPQGVRAALAAKGRPHCQSVRPDGVLLAGAAPADPRSLQIGGATV